MNKLYWIRSYFIRNNEIETLELLDISKDECHQALLISAGFQNEWIGSIVGKKTLENHRKYFKGPRFEEWKDMEVW